MAVFRSNMHIYAQIIDDVRQYISCRFYYGSGYSKQSKHTSNVEAAKAVGEAIAKKALEKGITEVVFDRGGYVYHGKIQALADAAREAGLQF
ncbi:MAG: 50S ribosomal protein L18 [Lachnospirales bacterium]